jgi:hypothetical protein
MCENDCNKMKKKLITVSNSKIQLTNCRNRETEIHDYAISWFGKAITIGGCMGLSTPNPLSYWNDAVMQVYF